MYLEMIDRAKPQKLYHQLLEILKGFIETGEWRVGAQIPTEEQLCEQFNVSKATVRLAIGELVLLGYLKRIQGKGTFVRRKRSGHNITMFLDLGENGLYNHLSCIVRVIENQICQPEEEIKDHLGLSEGDYCLGLKRLVIAEGVPLKVERLYTSRALRPGLPGNEGLTDLSIYSFLENRCGIKVQRVKEVIDLVPLGSEDATLLEMASGPLALRTRHISYVNSHTPVSYAESIYRTDTYPKTFEFERLS